jgi:hypothetical protein
VTQIPDVTVGAYDPRPILALYLGSIVGALAFLHWFLKRRR